MFKWIHHLLNPHCPDCKAEKKEKEFCKTCEALSYEIERLRSENERLLARVLEKPEKVVDRTVAPEPMAPLPRRVPWRVRQQMLEAEDRQKARILATAPKPDASIEELEQEMDLVEGERNAERG